MWYKIYFLVSFNSNLVGSWASFIPHFSYHPPHLPIWPKKISIPQHWLTGKKIIWWKMTFNGRQSLMEDNLQWKTTFDGRQLLMEDNLQWKTTFDGRWPSMEDDLQWNTAFNGRRRNHPPPSENRFFSAPKHQRLLTSKDLPGRGIRSVR